MKLTIGLLIGLVIGLTCGYQIHDNGMKQLMNQEVSR